MLLHELHHCRRRDPFRYAVALALKDICFYLPILGCLAQYLGENAELRADRVAIVGAGRPFLLSGLFVQGLAGMLHRLNRFFGAISLDFGALLAVMGIMVYMGNFARLAGLFPALLEDTGTGGD